MYSKSRNLAASALTTLTLLAIPSLSQASDYVPVQTGSFATDTYRIADVDQTVGKCELEISAVNADAGQYHIELWVDNRSEHYSVDYQAPSTSDWQQSYQGNPGTFDHLSACPALESTMSTGMFNGTDGSEDYFAYCGGPAEYEGDSEGVAAKARNLVSTVNASLSFTPDKNAASSGMIQIRQIIGFVRKGAGLAKVTTTHFGCIF